MIKITSVFTTNRLCLFSFLLLCSLFVSENAFSRKNWDSRFMKVYYDDSNSSIIMNNKVFDYYFGPGNENGFLEYCSYEYSTDGEHFTHLMGFDVSNQKMTTWTWILMRYKKQGAKIQFLNTYLPEAGSFWVDDDFEKRVEVKDLVNKPREKGFHLAHLVVKWTLAPEDVNINYIRIRGKWKVNGLYDGDNIDQVYEVFRQGPPDVDAEGNLRVSKKSTAMVLKESDEIIIKGAEPGENIKVYTTTGAEVKSVVSCTDVVNIKLANNQVYIVSRASTLQSSFVRYIYFHNYYTVMAV